MRFSRERKVCEGQLFSIEKLLKESLKRSSKELILLRELHFPETLLKGIPIDVKIKSSREILFRQCVDKKT